MNLDDLKSGDIAIVVKACCPPMMELGFVSGAKIEIVESSFSGVKVKVNGTTYAMRHECAKLVEVMAE